MLDFQKTSSPGSQRKAFNIAPPRLSHKRNVSLATSPSKEHPVFRDSVYYIGKVTISQPQAPPKFIDDVLVKLNIMHNSELKGKRGSFGMGLPKRSSFNDDYETESVIRVEKGADKVAESAPFGRTCRQRSVSDGDKLDISDLSAPQMEPVSQGHEEEEVTLSNIQEEVHSRLVTLQISKASLMLFSVGNKNLLLEKKIKNISFCTKVGCFFHSVTFLILI